MSATDELLRLVHIATAPMRTAINNMAVRVVVQSVNDSPKLQQLIVTALAGEELDDVEHMQPGGLSHVPLKGAEGLLVCVGGSRDVPMAIGVSNREHRPTGMASGETAMYAAETDGVQGRIRPGEPMQVTSGGSADADDFVAQAGKTLARLEALETAHNTHIHITTATIGLSPVGVIAPPAIIVTPAITAVASTNLKADD